MLDLIVLWLLTRHVRRVAEMKQKPAGGHVLWTVCLYIALEVTGVFVGMLHSVPAAVIGGILGAGAAVAITLSQMAAMPDGRMEGRGPESIGPQLVGSPCAACSKRITSVIGAGKCSACGAARHDDCDHDHQRAHAAGS